MGMMPNCEHCGLKIDDAWDLKVESEKAYHAWCFYYKSWREAEEDEIEIGGES